MSFQICDFLLYSEIQNKYILSNVSNVFILDDDNKWGPKH